MKWVPLPCNGLGEKGELSLSCPGEMATPNLSWSGQYPYPVLDRGTPRQDKIVVPPPQTGPGQGLRTRTGLKARLETREGTWNQKPWGIPCPRGVINKLKALSSFVLPTLAVISASQKTLAFSFLSLGVNGPLLVT